MKYRLAIVASHVIQYQDPFFRLLAQDPDVDLTVLYCSRAGAESYRDEDMKTTLAWDIELLKGYRYRFLRNLARDSNAGYGRLINPGIVPALARGRYDAVIFMFGWGAVTALLGMVTCWITRTPFFLYGDSSFPPPERTFRAKLRAWFLRRLFARATGFMVSGTLNAGYYRHYGADERTFFLLPWAVDNKRFSSASADALRERYGIAPGAVVILFSAKLVARKDPMTLLRAFEAMTHRGRAALVFMGDGELRAELETYACEHQVENVHFIGFVNQREIPGHYAMSDVFVLPSVYEPRGAVINEAMVCGQPVIVTDRCGSIGDIVQENDNAFIYPAGDAAALRAALDTIVSDDALRARMGERSRAIIADWDFARGVAGVRQMLAWVKSR
ncbi:MAG TPA: glycosyltransferase family 4 protein [Thermoanaerobaculia bacterium]